MTDDIDKHLRSALRTVDPPEGFADRVLARLDADSETSRVVPLRPRLMLRRYWYSGAALAASVVFAVMAIDRLEGERREREGLEARRQLLEALRVTSEKLDIAYQAVNAPQPADDDTARLMNRCAASLADHPCATGA